MGTLTVHDIVRAELYRILKPDTIVLTGEEIINNARRSRFSPDTLISIKSDKFYTIITSKDTAIISGQDIINSLPIPPLPPPLPEFLSIMGWGAFFLGFVLGWNLYFLNRHRKKDGVNINDLTIISGALIGAAIFAFFDENLRLLGNYGVGVGIGFIVYGLLLAILIKISGSGEDPLPLDSGAKPSLSKQLLTLHIWPLYWESNGELESRLNK